MHQVREQARSKKTEPLRSAIVSVASLTAAERKSMFALMQRHYDNVQWNQFVNDLNAKQWVVVVHDQDDEVRGFATQDLQTHTVDGQPLRVLFSGDTIVDRRYWGNNPLIGAWGQFALDLIDTYRDEPLYWHLISKGYKTYRLLPLFFHEFYPRYDRPSPQVERRRIDHVSHARFPNQYDATAGVVRAAVGDCRLSDGIAEITTARLRDPHVQFFLQRNPQHGLGDELSCLAPLSRKNFTTAAYRVIQRCSDTSDASTPSAPVTP